MTSELAIDVTVAITACCWASATRHYAKQFLHNQPNYRGSTDFLFQGFIGTSAPSKKNYAAIISNLFIAPSGLRVQNSHVQYDEQHLPFCQTVRNTVLACDVSA